MNLKLDSVCRICLNNCGIKNIFSERQITKHKTCYEIMNSLFSFSANAGDGFPTKICRKCTTKLSSAFELKMLAESSHLTLQETILNGAFHIPSEQINVKLECDADECDVKVELDGVMTEETSCAIKDDDIQSEEAADVRDDCCSNIGGGAESDDDDDKPLITIKHLEEEILHESDCNKVKSGDSYSAVVANVARSTAKRKHQAVHESRKGEECAMVCHLCGKLVSNPREHQKIHSAERSGQGGAGRRLVPCGDCPKVFTNHSGRRRHRAVHHLGISYFCHLCNKSFKRGDDHIRAVHSLRPKDFFCLLCEKRFHTQAELSRHTSYHTQEKPFPCPVCQKEFRNKTSRDYHRRMVHEKEKTVKCDHCSKFFFNKSILHKHAKFHSSHEKKYMCKECGRCFWTATQLKIHEKRHAGIKDVICTVCNTAFRTNGNLKSHMLTHTKEKIHPCKYCGVRFGRKDHRNNHERAVHKKII